jgi:hypothetical protein
MKKYLTVFALVIVLAGIYGIKDGFTQQPPHGFTPVDQVPGEPTSQETYDNLVKTVSAQTTAIRSLAAELEEVKQRVDALEKRGVR